MMFLKLAENIPGGRTLVFLLPLILLAFGFATLSSGELIQIDNAVILSITVALLFSWRRSILIFLKEREDAGSVWLSLGVFTIIIATVVNVTYSTWIRAYSIPMNALESPVIAGIRFAYAFGFGCLYLVPLAREAIVPPTGWISLMAIVAFSSAATLICMSLF